MRFANTVYLLLPFACFAAGYFVARSMLQRSTVTIPALVGKTADTALVLLSEKQLNPRIIGLVDEPDLEPGTVITQIPGTNALARPHQTIFLVLASRPSTHIAPYYVGISEEQIRKKCSAEKGEPIFVHIPHSLPSGICFAQFPSEGVSLSEKAIYYISSGIQETYVWPSFLNTSAYEAIESLKKQGVQVTIMGDYTHASTEELKQLRIIDQRPLPGSFVQCDTIHSPSLHVRLAR